MSARRAGAFVASAVAASALAGAAPAGAAAPVVNQMVVFEDGSSKVSKVRASATRVKVWWGEGFAFFRPLPTQMRHRFDKMDG